jgi:hypothetical protein
LSIFEAQVVGTFRVHKTSLIAIGTPASGPSDSPRALRESIERADAIAPSASMCRKALIDPLSRSILLSAACVHSNALMSPRATAPAISQADMSPGCMDSCRRKGKKNQLKLFNRPLESLKVFLNSVRMNSRTSGLTKHRRHKKIFSVMPWS